MLHDLLNIKKIREKSAHKDVLKCRRLLEESKQEQRNREQALKDYIDWRCKEEQALYDNILNAEVRQKNLDFLKQKVAAMREKDAELEQAVEVANNHVLVAEKELGKAQEAHHKTMQAVDKFKEFTKVMDEEAAKEAERLENIEMEEFSVRPNR